MRRVLAFTAAFLLVSPAYAAEYEIDPAHTYVGFTVRHLMVSNVKGQFPKVKGNVTYDESNPAASMVQVEIDVSSVDTREPKRDDHLRNEDFFDVRKYPKMTFKSTKVEPLGQGKLKVTGDLTIRGITKPITLEVHGPTEAVRDPWGNIRRGASATATLNRKDFGLTWNKVMETGGLVVGDEVQITIETELLEKKPKEDPSAA